MKLKLGNGSCVCIIGGGPAGCFAAINLLRYAEETGLKPEVIIFEFRDGRNGGPAGCKGCAGVLSSTLLKNLNSIGIDVPEALVLEKLRSYILHIPNIGGNVITVNQPDERRDIYSVARGGGPRIAPLGRCLSFDSFLREQAVERGAKLVVSRVRNVEWGDRPIVITETGNYKADFLVLATGVNSHNVLSPGFRYRPPETVIMVQNEFIKPDKIPAGSVAAFFGEPEDIFFGTLVPKGKYINTSLFGKHWQTIRENAVDEFMSAEAKKYFTSFPGSLCGCMPRIVVKPSRKFYGNRWVAVGDAVVSRLYKDGIGTAFVTSDGAMKSAVHNGISARDFSRGYKNLCREISRDNRMGGLMFTLFDFMLKNSFIAASIEKCVKEEKNLPLRKRVFTVFIWGMLTGDYSYRFLLRKFLGIRCTSRFVKNLFH